MAKKTRGGAAPDRQLSELQRRILVWIFRQQSTIETFRKVGGNVGIVGKGIPTGSTFNEFIKRLKQKGIPWSAKRFYDAVPTGLESKSLSRALVSLEKRGLLIRHDITEGLSDKSRTAHVRLTKLGWDAAHFYVENRGRSERELKELLTPAERFVRKRLYHLRGKLKTEQVYLKMLKEKKLWDEEFSFDVGIGLEGVAELETRLEIAGANIAEAQEEIERTERQIAVMEKLRDHPDLDRILDDPDLMSLKMPGLVYRGLLERASKEEGSIPNYD